MKNRQRCFAVLLILTLFCSLLAGCHGERTETEPETDYAITWKKAFRSTDYPEGGMTNDQVAFARSEADGYAVDAVSRQEMERYDDGGYLPRYSFFSDAYPAELELLVHCLSYAQVHHYERFVLPMDQAFLDQLLEADRDLWWSMEVHCDSNRSNTAELEDGSKLYYCLYVMKAWPGTDYETWAKQQDKAFAAAKQVLADMPDSCSTEYDKALYLYQYLTDNVEYAYDDYYRGDQDYYDFAQNVYYDTLIDHMTVCSGYGWTFAWLCELAGLTALHVTGQASETEAHAWTIVRVDGKYYWFDPTWDAGTEPWAYSYFGISDEEMEERGFRHLYQAYETILPACEESLPLPEPPEGIDTTAATRSGLVRGITAGRTYRNDSLNLSCVLPEGWSFLRDPEIGQGTGADRTSLDRLLQDSDLAVDMYAEADTGAAYVSIENFKDAAEGVTEEQFAEAALEAMKQRAARLNYGEFSGGKVRGTLAGQACWGIQVTYVQSGESKCRWEYYRKQGSCFVTIAVTCQDPTAAAALMDLFCPPED